MEHDAFRYDFTIKELMYFLFNKKRCPKCNGKMMKSKEFESVKGAEFNIKTETFFVPSASVKHYIYVYTCQNCGSKFKLSKLSEL